MVHGQHGGKLLMGKFLGDIHGFYLADKDLGRFRYGNTCQLGNGKGRLSYNFSI